MGVGRWELGDGSWKMEDGSWEMKVGRRKAENLSLKLERLRNREIKILKDKKNNILSSRLCQS